MSGMILVPEFKGLMANRNVLGTLVRRDLRVRYARSVLGYLWSVLDPLAMSLIYFLVFTLIFKARHVGNEPYFLHLLTGLLVWQWFSLCMTETSRALLQESRLVKSTNLPRELWVVRVVLAKGVEFVLSLPILVIFVAIYVIRGEAHLNWTLVYFPVGMVLTFILATGVGLILAPITVLVTDMARVVRIGLRMGFYATPIIYSVQSAPESIRRFLIFNPMSGIMELFRSGFFESELGRRAVVISIVLSVLVFIVGTAVFKRFEAPVLKEI
ncbi:MAG: ABC transporter permease [Intrasporangium sp.]|uniref:ABC transporter permease n=1 Tax=Intrasporangium sp. TaxID=1925024 RepID=UPI002648A49A|nr:ABC transporter permease [Intrasporangium sp.]MDN5794471.1 ABC transporter permease [Intrasporangium sp.]